MSRWLSSAIFVLLAVGSIAGVTGAPAAREQTCGGKDLVGSSPLQNGQVPVLLVHGMLGSPADWEKKELDGSASIAARVRKVDGVVVREFDYHQRALDWVSDPGIGAKLAEAVTCLSEATGRRVIVVAHSMGGLATQYAAALPDGHGGTIADHIGEVVAIGVPFNGSKLLSALQTAITGGEAATPDLAVSAAAEAILSACAGIGLAGLVADIGDPCSVLAIPRSPIGAALEYDSSAIAVLPSWPTEVPVKTIVGDGKLTLGIWRLRHTFDLGDTLVSQDSASAYHTDGAPIQVGCDLTVITMFSSSCYHGKLLRNPTVVGEVLSVIRNQINRYGVTPSFSPTGTVRSWRLALPDASDNLLTAISCPTADFCVVVDQHGNAFQFQNGGWSGPSATGLGSGLGDTTDVSCATATSCVAIGGESGVATYTGGSQWQVAANYPGSGAVSAISCPTTTFCMAVDGVGAAAEFDGSTWSTPAYVIGDANDQMASMDAVSCPTADFCAALDSQGGASLWQSGSWTGPQALAPGQDYNQDPSFNNPGAISCASPTFCTAVSRFGVAYTWDGSTWSTTQADANPLNAVACPQSGSCVAGDETPPEPFTGSVVVLSAGHWSAPREVDSNAQVEGVACPTIRTCFAFDPDGLVFRLS
jgi:pimeloyl-ACP methyl ester carboxylesterase